MNCLSAWSYFRKSICSLVRQLPIPQQITFYFSSCLHIKLSSVDVLICASLTTHVFKALHVVWCCICVTMINIICVPYTSWIVLLGEAHGGSGISIGGFSRSSRPAPGHVRPNSSWSRRGCTGSWYITYLPLGISNPGGRWWKGETTFGGIMLINVQSLDLM
jgi:hypothetical protein